MEARNPQRVDATRIDIEVFHQGDWHPFTADLNDPYEHGRELYARALAGEFGEIAPPPVKREGGAPRALN